MPVLLLAYAIPKYLLPITAIEIRTEADAWLEFGFYLLRWASLPFLLLEAVFSIGERGGLQPGRCMGSAAATE